MGGSMSCCSHEDEEEEELKPVIGAPYNFRREDIQMTGLSSEEQEGLRIRAVTDSNRIFATLQPVQDAQQQYQEQQKQQKELQALQQQLQSQPPQELPSNHRRRSSAVAARNSRMYSAAHNRNSSIVIPGGGNRNSIVIPGHNNRNSVVMPTDKNFDTFVATDSLNPANDDNRESRERGGETGGDAPSFDPEQQQQQSQRPQRPQRPVTPPPSPPLQGNNGDVLSGGGSGTVDRMMAHTRRLSVGLKSTGGYAPLPSSTSPTTPTTTMNEDEHHDQQHEQAKGLGTLTLFEGGMRESQDLGAAVAAAGEKAQLHGWRRDSGGAKS